MISLGASGAHARTQVVVWTAPTPQPVEVPLMGTDRPLLEGYLAWQRRTLVNICAGLNGDQLASRPVPTSKLSLLGLIRHVAQVERYWLRQHAAGQVLCPMYDPMLKDADFENLDPARADNDLRRLHEEWRQADAAVAFMDFDDTFHVQNQVFSLRMTYVHLIGEYARHNGHADLLRESIDGATGR